VFKFKLVLVVVVDNFFLDVASVYVSTIVRMFAADLPSTTWRLGRYLFVLGYTREEQTFETLSVDTMHRETDKKLFGERLAMTIRILSTSSSPTINLLPLGILRPQHHHGQQHERCC
jgi:hypothetical protein